MKLEDLGYNTKFEKFRKNLYAEGYEIGRVVAEHKEKYVVRTAKGEFEAEITGNMRFTARNREDFPAVGDWIALRIYDNALAIIHNILPRFSMIKRQAVGRYGEVQVIATNIDHAFLVQSVDRDYNINRLERYLTICNASNVSPVIVLSKTDLADPSRIREITNAIKLRIRDVMVIAISNKTQDGYTTIKQFIKKGKTYCMLGSSGAGKSTLLNNLAGKAVMKTDTISTSTNKGKHVTSHRALFVLENGGIIIDNPGMREVGIADTTGGLEATFDSITRLSQSCKFKDCTHTGESGCAVMEAVEKEAIDRASYENYLKMRKESVYFESTVAERRRKDKNFGKMLKKFKKDMRNNDYNI